ncbi:MAG: phage holin, LLH family [Bacilli bacterium]
MDAIRENLLLIVTTIISGVFSYVGLMIKTTYNKIVNDKAKKEIVDLTVKYVEQVSKSAMLNSEEKLQKAKEKALEWLKERKLSISETELEILIESAVNALSGGLK